MEVREVRVGSYHPALRTLAVNGGVVMAGKLYRYAERA